MPTPNRPVISELPYNHTMAFLPCSQCHRHVRDNEAACPFCGNTIISKSARALPVTRLARGAMFAFASVVAGCGGSDDSTGTTVTDTGSVSADTSTSSDTGAKSDTGSASDSGTNTDSTVTDSGSSTDTGKADAPADTETKPEVAPDVKDDDAGPAPLYGLPPPP
jgi:hypothetical protein